MSAERLGVAARLANYFVDVVCTSGSGTGHAPSAEKIATMKKAIVSQQGSALAIASGVDENNVLSLLEAGADCILVASSVSKTFDTLDPEKLARLTALVHNFTPVEKASVSSE